MGTPDMFEKTQYDKFMEFHTNNPQVYKRFEKYALQAIRAGRKKYSHWVIIGLVRWDYEVKTKSSDDFKINNNHIAYFARMFMLAHPEHDGFFNIKSMKN